jgi:hypothetical protein
MEAVGRTFSFADRDIKNANGKIQRQTVKYPSI